LNFASLNQQLGHCAIAAGTHLWSAMTDEATLLFTEAEWKGLIPDVVAQTTAYLRPYRAPIFEDHGDHGAGWGSGSFLRLGDRIFILTNEHVAAAREQNRPLGTQLLDCDEIWRIAGDHLALPDPFDLALLPVGDHVWNASGHGSQAIEIAQIAVAHEPFPNELLVLSGFAGERVKFIYSTLCSQATCYTAREIVLPYDARFSERFHFGIDYRPDLAADVIDKKGLPLPPGLSGSTVWNTGLVEARAAGLTWSPDMARVTGVVWGWPSDQACLVATRAEYLRSFLLGAVASLQGA
jgi:hypothetical protein